MSVEVSIVELRKDTSEIINRTLYQSERAVITRHSKPVAVIVSLEDAELLERLEDLVDLGLAREALAEYEAKGGVDWEDLKEDLGL